MKKLISSLALCSVALMTYAETPLSPLMDTDIKSAVSSQVTDGVWIDVRTVEEYASGHLTQAINLPVDEIGQSIQSVVPNKDTAIHLYCRSGRRAEVARQTLLDMGYQHVINHGAYDDLKQQTH